MKRMLRVIVLYLLFLKISAHLHWLFKMLILLTILLLLILFTNILHLLLLSIGQPFQKIN